MGVAARIFSCAGSGAGDCVFRIHSPGGNIMRSPVDSAGSGWLEFGGSERTSTTNVQVKGIDEPDIVKVDDKNIFTSFARNRYIEPVPLRDTVPGVGQNPTFMPPPKQLVQTTDILNALPPKDLKKIGAINNVGNLLLSKDTLVIFTDKIVYGYNVSNKTNPKEVWNIPYEEKTQYRDARLYDGKVYLITSTIINISDPCPYKPIIVNGQSMPIPCTDIYHPILPVPTELTYTIFKIDTTTGKIEDSVSFVAGSQNTVLYMSEKNIYLTYSYSEDTVSIFTKFFKEAGSGILPKYFFR